MPEVFREFGFVFFYSNDGQEPMHIHARKANGFAKFRIEPIGPDFAQGMKIASIDQISKIEIICEGTGLHWPQLDEDPSVTGILEGRVKRCTTLD